ncbi:MAG: transglutaminase domain-containing protein [Gammaproteobacteria bacterium]|nr:transglutaminase domain-containing protein [Gammaproteobacteria bacterium]
MHRQAALLLAAALAVNDSAAEPYRFDAAEDYLAPAAQWDTWQDARAAFTAELRLIESCNGAATSLCSSGFRAVNRLLLRVRDFAPDDRVRAINAWVNRRRYREDRAQRATEGKLPNEWRSLTDLIRRGGDCEDFAMAKYFLLREAGIPAARLRMVVAWDKPTHAYHALLAYDTEAGAWLFETDGSIKRRSQHAQYRFLYSVNEDGVWDHAPAEGATTARRNGRESS